MEASERHLLAREASRLGFSLSDDQLDRLVSYAELLQRWNSRIRLLGDRDPAALIRKHLPDCLALVPLLPDRGIVADIGTGPGLPGFPLACVRPQLSYWLIESRRRPVSFLQEAKARLGLAGVLVVEGRAEDMASKPEFGARAAIVTARAVSMQQLVRYAVPLLDVSGRLLVMQSRTEAADLARSTAHRAGFEVVDVRDYTLLGGEPRRVLVLSRR